MKTCRNVGFISHHLTHVNALEAYSAQRQTSGTGYPRRNYGTQLNHAFSRPPPGLCSKCGKEKWARDCHSVGVWGETLEEQSQTSHTWSKSYSHEMFGHYIRGSNTLPWPHFGCQNSLQLTIVAAWCCLITAVR